MRFLSGLCQNFKVEEMTFSRWPTVVVAVAIATGWIALVTSYGHIPVVLTIIGLTFLGAWYGSLQHEVIHGHLPRWVAWLPLNLLLPFERYRTTHLDHHSNQLITDPLEDPESFYMTPERWASLTPWHRRVMLFSRTMIGRMALGPVLYHVNFVWRDVRNARRNGFSQIWISHVLAALGVAGLVRFLGMPLWVYLVGFVYGGSSLTLLRSFVEHRAVPVGTLSAVVETNPLMSLVFLNNNLHHAHHLSPGTPWFALPALCREVGAAQEAQAGAGLYRGYLDVARRYAFRPFCQPVRAFDSSPEVLNL